MRHGEESERRLASAFARRMESRFGWAAAAECVLPLADLVQGVYAALTAFTAPGDGVIVQTPCYPPFREAIVSTGRRLVPLPMRDDGDRHVFDLGALPADAQPRLLILCNPQNPTGRVFERGELQQLADFALRHDLLVVSDEIHADLVYPGGRHIPFAALGPDIAARTLTVTSATKGFNIPGLRCGVLHFGAPELHARFTDRLPARLLGQPSVVGVEATVAAWDEGQPWLDAVMAHLRQARDHVVATLAQEVPQIVCRAPEGTFLAWLDCSALGLETTAFRFFHDEAKVAFSAGETFDPEARQFVRFNFATSMPILDDILGRVIDAVRRRA
jgi:cystathionine beta-lyase